MNKAWRAALLLGAVALAFGVMGILGHGAHGRKALEQYKAELRAEGEKLTYVELMQLRTEHANDSVVSRCAIGSRPTDPACSILWAKMARMTAAMPSHLQVRPMACGKGVMPFGPPSRPSSNY